MNETSLIPIVLVAVLSVLGNIAYFEYKSRREVSSNILQERLTKLLLPLYYALKTHELEIHIWLNKDLDVYEYESDKPEHLLEKLGEIIRQNLYLADDKLHLACLNFLEWAYSADTAVRFQKIHEGDLAEDKIFNDFRQVVYAEYERTKKLYVRG